MHIILLLLLIEVYYIHNSTTQKPENATAWVSEGEFYTDGFVLHNFIEPDTFACCAWLPTGPVDIIFFGQRDH